MIVSVFAPLLVSMFACVEPAFVPSDVKTTTPSDTSPGSTADCAATDTPVAADDDSVIGISAEGLASFIGDREATLTYTSTGAYAGTPDTTVRLSGALEGDPLLRTWEALGSGDCANDSLIVSLALSLSTDDGLFTESWVEELHPGEWQGTLYLGPTLDIADHVGSFNLTGTEALSVPMNLSDSTWSGEIVAVDYGNQSTMTTECGIAGWNGSLLTGC